MGSNHAKGSTPILLWIVGIVAIVWNGLGCVNLFQQMSPEGLATLPPDYQAFVEARPTWTLIAFAVSVIAGLSGAGLLLMRSDKSVSAFVLSGVGALVATIPTLGAGMASVLVGSALFIVLAAFFAWYALRKLG
ncbi:hypothetical protein MUY35_07740 [Aliiroseovarius sp. S1339]|uniref:hypothetical protein n=1 Tax=Aliiroseovarius sp. S1339 TaxID=2936990 RepID=UPI0020BE947C|nr:hypothetical protein [Aliiroseovarius sp. S1339]MCK8463739.1 hypothetical protein [Aliiroseovarius sp. S1339]